MEMIVIDDLCRGCGVCIGACPNNAISLCGGKAIIDQDKCRFCQSCINVCPRGALQLSKGEEIAVLSEQNTISVMNTPETQNLTQQKGSWGVLALSLFGQYVLPKMMELVTSYFEQRLVSTSESGKVSSEESSFNYSNHRRRQRHGRMIS